MTNANGSTPIFRTIEIAKDVPITLGEPLSAQAMALMEPAGPQHFRPRPGTYGGAQEIDIYLTVGGAVERMEFSYADTTYQAMLMKFEAELGPPASQDGDETSVWQDPNTLFELMGGSSVHSTLRDLALTSEQAAS